jgi:hypothetical protein
MTVFQIITIIISALALFGGIVAVYVKTQVDIAKINVTIAFFQKDLDRKEVAILRFEAENKADHSIILNKIDSLITKDNVKV